MCILIHKPKGIKFPSKETLQNCFDSNPDGCGYAWVDKVGISHIRKGFLNFSEFYESLSKNMDKLILFDIAIHFRFATHGSIIPGNTHPFPVSCRINDLKAVRLDGKFKIMAHNGIISSLGKRAKKTKSDLSDTMVFAKEIRSFGENNKGIKKILDDGKFVIMDSKGSRRYGNFIEEEGVFYSNDSYLGYDMIWSYYKPKGKKPKNFDYFDIKPCKMDLNKNGECIHSKYCIDQFYCEISGRDLTDIVGIEEYERICPILKDENLKRDILLDIWNDENNDEFESKSIKRIDTGKKCVYLKDNQYYYYY